MFDRSPLRRLPWFERSPLRRLPRMERSPLRRLPLVEVTGIVETTVLVRMTRLSGGMVPR